MAKLKTGRHTSAIRELRRANRKRLQNNMYKTQLNFLVQRIKKSVRKGDLETAKKLVNDACSVYDKSTKKGIIHRNEAARKKSQLTTYLHSSMNKA
ncbi:MAG: 30S ribosomal protein S20 [Elusimicrobia bacterium]|nr:30S ribosomal protein S20 [Elusimicrobiota bacterium]